MRCMPAVSLLALVLLFGIEPAWRSAAVAHCDGMDGPVVKAAQRALETGDINYVLIWVQPNDGPAIREAFDRTLTVRKLSPEAMHLADMYFFETLVRIHRTGEGAPYTGLKPAGRDLGPAIPAADKAVESGSIEPLLELLTGALTESVRSSFRHVLAAKGFNSNDVAAGREFIEAYVTFVHRVEGIYQAASQQVGGHYDQSDGVEGHGEAGAHEEGH